MRNKTKQISSIKDRMLTMKKMKRLPLFVVSILVIAGVIIYFVFLRNDGPYADIAGEWQRDTSLHTGNETTKAVWEIEKEIGKSELQTLKIDSKGNLTLHNKLLDIKKDEDDFQLPKKREKKVKEISLEVKKMKREESPMFSEYLDAILRGLATYGSGSDFKKEFNVEELKEIIKESNYSKKQLSELAKQRQEQLEENPEMYQNIVVSDNLITYEVHPEGEYFIRLVDADTIELVNKEKENEYVLGIYNRK
jgi:hypothetical protein